MAKSTKAKAPKTEAAAPSRKANTAVEQVLTTLQVKPSKLVLTEKFRGRTTLIGDDEQIVLADTIRTEGQKQPLQVRAIEGTDTYEVIFGNSRKLAGDLIAGGYKSGSRDIAADPAFTLRCEVVVADDKVAFVSNVVENAHRNMCSPIDNANNQQTLRDEHEMSDNGIAKLYGYTGAAYVNRLKKLLVLPDFVQEAIHNRSMSASAGFILAEAKDVAEADAYEEVWAKVKSDGDEDDTNIGRMEIAAAIKEWRKEQKEEANGGKDGDGDDEVETDTDSKSVILSRSAFRKLIEEIGGDERCPDKTGQMCIAILDTIDGKIASKGLLNRMLKLLGEEPLAVKPKAKEEAKEGDEPKAKKAKAK